jgi:hypothetical protein
MFNVEELACRNDFDVRFSLIADLTFASALCQKQALIILRCPINTLTTS